MSPTPTYGEAEYIDLGARQIFASASSTTPVPTGTPGCLTWLVQGPGVLKVNSSFALNLTDDAAYQACGYTNDSSPFNSTIGDNDTIDNSDPYFASTSPVTFVLGVCVTVAWILLIMLLMTPRTYLSGVGSSRRRPDEGINVVGIGSRPWFQKVATMFVAIALLIATINTFRDAELQYNDGFQDSAALTRDVLGSLEIRIIRFISTIFEWLAQAQTALRLFARHRERIAIKWIALTLIVLEMIFAIINSFTDLGTDEDGGYVTKVRRVQNAFPAMQYLFELALSLLYAAVIFYYAMTKSRFAFYHPEMWNITLVAIMSMVAVLVPVVFFVMDIAVPSIASWGVYVRWVGAAAASVIVWEWVERIEALEREERKDGILGREIYEGDDMLGGEGGAKARRERGFRRRKQANDNNTETASPTSSSMATDSSSNSLKKFSPDPKSRYARVNKDVLRKIAAIRSLAKAKNKQVNTSNDVELQPATGAVRRRKQRVAATGGTQPPPLDPAAAAQTSASPVSRSDCTSASTVYRVVHHSVSPSSTPGISETLGQTMNIVSPVQEEPEPDAQGETRRSFSMANVFRRRSSGHSGSVPPEILAQQAQAQSEADSASATRGKGRSGFGFFSRFRRAGSEERELPDLVVPWRGQNNATPLQDLEAGQREPSVSFDEPGTVYYNGGSQHMQRHDDEDNDDLSRAQQGQRGTHNGNTTVPDEPERTSKDLPP